MVIKTMQNWTGPLLVGTAAFLWATDALVRYPAIGTTDPSFIVLLEHFLAVALLFPWMLYKYKMELFSLSPLEWLAAAFSGMGGSAIATVLFTASFLYINPSIAILLQKFQPVLVVLIAFIALGERPVKKFYFWGFIALVAGMILSFPDLNFKFLSEGLENVHSKGFYYALGAALLWAASTVFGKILLNRTPPSLAAFWRFVFGLIAMIGFLIAARNFPDMTSLYAKTNWVSLLYLSLVPGLIAMLFYYSGLARTPAIVTTFIELVYPIGAVILNTYFLHTALNPVQTGAGLVLVISVAMLSF
jgi:drug/metabolite transporter (DMT)-like permease